MIRPYDPKDLDQLLDAWRSASEVGHPFLDEAFFAKERKAIAEVYMPNAETWVYETDGKVVGFIALAGDEIGGLFVHADYHGKGLGKALVDHARTVRAHLFLKVFEKNEVGRAFYKRYGFEKVGEEMFEDVGLMQHVLALPKG